MGCACMPQAQSWVTYVYIDIRLSADGRLKLTTLSNMPLFVFITVCCLQSSRQHSEAHISACHLSTRLWFVFPGCLSGFCRDAVVAAFASACGERVWLWCPATGSTSAPVTSLEQIIQSMQQIKAAATAARAPLGRSPLAPTTLAKAGTAHAASNAPGSLAASAVAKPASRVASGSSPKHPTALHERPGVKLKAAAHSSSEQGGSLAGEAEDPAQQAGAGVHVASAKGPEASNVRRASPAGQALPEEAQQSDAVEKLKDGVSDHAGGMQAGITQNEETGTQEQVQGSQAVPSEPKPAEGSATANSRAAPSGPSTSTAAEAATKADSAARDKNKSSSKEHKLEKKNNRDSKRSTEQKVEAKVKRRRSRSRSRSRSPKRWKPFHVILLFFMCIQ